jgi:peroxiredoxin
VSSRRQWAAVGAIVLLLGGALAAATRFLGPELFPVSVGSAAPEFRAQSLDVPPRPRGLADYRGQVVLLNIWATWCKPCEVEMPSIERLYRELGPRGLRVVAVSVDDPGTDATIRAWVNERGLTFDVVHDPSGRIQEAYQTTGVPETFVIGRDGVIRKKVIGAVNWNSAANRSLIAQLLGDAAS